MNEPYIMALDQGTSGTKTVIFDSRGQIAAKATQPLKSYFPCPGYVEQDPLQIYQNVLESVKKCLQNFSANSLGKTDQIIACGISNQRETFVLWDNTGRPLCPAIVWQCKRSVEICNRLKETDLETELQKRTGLIIDPYFSGTKLIWLYENHPQIKNAIDTGKAYFGTIDSWLLFKLTGGRNYLTDYTNASRTLFFNINSLQWDEYLLEKFHLDTLKLPQAQPSSHEFGASDFSGLFADKIPILALIGDSHAAAFGEGCFTPGSAKATLGTGCSILMNIGAQKRESKTGMVTTICWSMPDRVDYALEGIIVSSGTTVKWLRDQLGLFAESSQTQDMAFSVGDNHGVYLIPAFSGLGSPHWQMDAKAAITGLTLDCDKNHIVRAALESIPYQIKDVINAMENDSGIFLKELKVDGAIAANRFVMQFLADLLDKNVINIGLQEVSALGAAYLAGLHAGVFVNLDRIRSLNTNSYQYKPNAENETVASAYLGWKKAVQHMCQ